MAQIITNPWFLIPPSGGVTTIPLTDRNQEYNILAGDEAFSAQNLAIDRIVQISNGITGSDQSKSKGPVEESIRAFETVRPFALYAVALTVRVGRGTNALQLIEGLLVACSPSLLQ